MVFTINPADAQAMQEDEAQLVAAILQATRGLASYSISSPTPAPKSDGLRIHCGRRLVYGSLANGQFRNDLNPDSLKLILDAVQRPVNPNADPANYQGKIPAIDIRLGDKVLFREERDGMVTVNQLQFQVNQPLSPASLPSLNGKGSRTEYPTPEVLTGRMAIPSVAFQGRTAMAEPLSAQALNGRTAIAEHPASEPQHHPTVIANPTAPHPLENSDWKADDMAQIAAYLLNPLGADRPMYDTVALQGYTITQCDRRLTIQRQGTPIVVAEGHTVIEQALTQQDWEWFQGMQQRLLMQVPPGQSIPGQHAPTTSVAVENNGSSNAIIPPALTVLQNQIARLPTGQTQALLKITANLWQQQIQPSLHNHLQQGMNWLTTRPQAIRREAAARAALALFNRGYERTGEKSYTVEGFRLTLRGLNCYTLSDASGVLLRFQAFKSAIPGIRQNSIQVVAGDERLDARLTPEVVRDLRDLQRNSKAMPRGNLDQEAVYMAKIHQVEQTVQTFLHTQVRAHVWDREGGRYRLELGDGETLRITDKQGNRGLLYQRHQGEVFSRLGAADFAHFDQLAQRLQRLNSASAQASPPQGLEIS